MRTALSYTSARVLMLVVSVVVLYLAGARGFLLIAAACLVSGIASFVLLSRQRDVMSSALMSRIRTRQQRRPGLRARLEDGARAEDDDL
jgi:cell division protein FtsW (lipid II flippase)